MLDVAVFCQEDCEWGVQFKNVFQSKQEFFQVPQNFNLQDQDLYRFNVNLNIEVSIKVCGNLDFTKPNIYIPVLHTNVKSGIIQDMFL